MIAMTTTASTHSCKGIYELICQVEFIRVPIRTVKVVISSANHQQLHVDPLYYF